MRSKSGVAKKNRADGRKLEGWLIKRLAKLFGLTAFNNRNLLTAEIGSTGMFSRALDSEKQDVWFKGAEYQKLSFQCKKSLTHSKDKKPIDVSALLVMNPNKIRILVTKLNCRPNKNEKEIGTFVTMYYEDFEKVFLQLWKKELNDTENIQE